MTATLLLTAMFLPLQAGALHGAETAQPAPARATVLTVTAEGVREETRFGQCAVNTSPSQAMTTQGTLWTHTSALEAWIPSAISIGDVGGQVFAEYDLNNEAAVLLSVYDSNPPTPVWTDSTPLGTEARQVDSAATTNTHIAIHQIPQASTGNRPVVLRKYTSNSPTPDWTYEFVPLTSARSHCAISRDGQTIVAAITNSNTHSVEVAVFAPGSGTPVSYTVLPPGVSNQIRGWDLSADGSTLYFSQDGIAHIFDVATQTVLFTTNIGSHFDSHAISGDGSVFAYGKFGSMHVWERSGGTYINSITRTLVGQNYCARIDISDDGSTIAYAWYFYNPGLTVQVNALDLTSNTITMTDTITGTGALQNVVAGVSCSADGSRFAVGLWGDEGDQAEEVRVYSSTQDAPLMTSNLPGSVLSIDISADGQRVVAGSKSVHANINGNGGQVDLLDTGNEDFILRGTPSVGATVEYEVHGTPGAPALLLTAPQPQLPPMLFPGIGTLYVKRSMITITPLGHVPNGGVLTSPAVVDAELLGTSHYAQVLFISPRQLSTDWMKITYLP